MSHLIESGTPASLIRSDNALMEIEGWCHRATLRGLRTSRTHLADVLSVAILISIFISALMSFSPQPRGWQGMALLSTLPAAALLLRFVPFVQLLRLNGENVSAVHHPFHRRRRMRWEEVKRVRLLHSIIELRGERAKIVLARSDWSHHDWLEIRGLLKRHLSKHFDFEAPTGYESEKVRVARLSSAGKLLRLLKLGVWTAAGAMLPMLPALFWGPGGSTTWRMTGFYATMALLGLLMLIIAWVAARQHAKNWRHRQHSFDAHP